MTVKILQGLEWELGKQMLTLAESSVHDWDRRRESKRVLIVSMMKSSSLIR
jgi:hypothetical protein